MKQSKPDEGWRPSDARWEWIEPLLPPPKRHPTGCHRPLIPKRAAIVAIWLVMRTGIRSCAAAYRRFREWSDARVFANFWRLGLVEYDELKGMTGTSWPVMVR